MFDTIESVKPGFINIKVSAGYLQIILIRCQKMISTDMRTARKLRL